MNVSFIRRHYMCTHVYVQKETRTKGGNSMISCVGTEFWRVDIDELVTYKLGDVYWDFWSLHCNYFRIFFNNVISRLSDEDILAFPNSVCFKTTKYCIYQFKCFRRKSFLSILLFHIKVTLSKKTAVKAKKSKSIER